MCVMANSEALQRRFARFALFDVANAMCTSMSLIKCLHEISSAPNVVQRTTRLTRIRCSRSISIKRALQQHVSSIHVRPCVLFVRVCALYDMEMSNMV